MKTALNDMTCIRNGIRLDFNGTLETSYQHKAVNVECGNGDLFKCDTCKEMAVDGFDIKIREI